MKTQPSLAHPIKTILNQTKKHQIGENQGNFIQETTSQTVGSLFITFQMVACMVYKKRFYNIKTLEIVRIILEVKMWSVKNQISPLCSDVPLCIFLGETGYYLLWFIICVAHKLIQKSIELNNGCNL